MSEDLHVCQCLLHTPLLRQHLHDTCKNPPEDPWLAELLGLCRLIDGAKRRGARYVDPPRRLTKLIAEASEEFAFGRQADPHEAFMMLTAGWLAGCVKVGDGSGTDCSKLGYSEKEQLEASSMIGHVFGGIMGSLVRCKSCTYESLVSRVEYCLCLTVTLGMTEEELHRCRQERKDCQDSSDSIDPMIRHTRRVLSNSTVGVFDDLCKVRDKSLPLAQHRFPPSWMSTPKRSTWKALNVTSANKKTARKEPSSDAGQTPS
eukprot:symbB.v1.2.035222.t1/scaffold4694.1/size36271/2